MRTTQKNFLPAILLFGLVASAPAFAANPLLEAYEHGIEDPRKHSKALGLSELKLDLDVAGGIADVTVNATFANPSDDLLEGRFVFELPDSAVITGYALDLEGTLVDGVLVEPLKARRTYEAQVREGVDPGLAAISRDNVFTTHIYPIPEKGSRKIRIKFSAPIHALRGLTFPLETAKPVGKFSISMRVAGHEDVPEVTVANLAAPLTWTKTRDGQTATLDAKRQTLSGLLRVAPAPATTSAIATRHPNGRRFFHIVDSAPRAAREPTGKRLRVYWDRSLSRRDDRLAEERALLANFVKQSQPAAIDLVIFNSSGARLRRVTPAELDGALRGVLYRGATSFQVLEALQVSAADTCLVFSDGVVTIDPRKEFKPGCDLFAITSAPDADRGFLARLVRSSNGSVLRLGPMSASDILARLTERAPRIVDVRSENGSALRFATLDASASAWSIVGESEQSRTIIVRIAGLGREIVERRYTLADPRPARFSGAGALWAADRVAQLSAEDGARAALVTLSRQFSVAGALMSFLVLEDPSDYLTAGVTPPANYPKELMQEYREAKKEFDADKRATAAGRLDDIIEKWDEQKDWWNTKFEPPVRRKSAPQTSGAAPPAAPAGYANEALSEVMVTGLRGSMQSSLDIASGISVSLEEWDPKRPYIKALDAAAADQVDQVLAREEQKYSALPAFYFDVAEWLYRRKRTADALELLLSALDLPTANEETVAMVADRLLRYQRFERAIWLYERAQQQSDYLPQTYRTLALALARRAEGAAPAAARRDLTRALKLLNHVVMTPWEEAYDGIELIALMDANMLLPRLQKLGVGDVPLDPRLRALLDVDLRVIIEWNTGATDMDLWVDQPDGERAIYSHPRTQIGGRLSNDMTAGFGPEEYLLRRAANGDYRISVNVYAADAINPNGKTVVTAHLIRDYGRATQREETMELELNPDDEGEKRIGTFTVH